MRPFSIVLLALIAAAPTAARAMTQISAGTTTYIASTDPYGSATDSMSDYYSDPSHISTPQFFTATSSLDGGSASASGYVEQGLMGATITASAPTAVNNLNADSQARATFSVDDIGLAHDTSGSLSTGAAFLKTFALNAIGTSSTQPLCCYDSLYVSAFFSVYDLTTGGNQIVALDYGVGPVANGATSVTATLHEGDQLELDYGIDMANYVSALEPNIQTLFADYIDTFKFFVSGGDSTGTVLSNSNGYDYSTVLSSAGPASGVPEVSIWAMLLIGFAGVGVMAKRRRSKSSGARRMIGEIIGSE